MDIRNIRKLAIPEIIFGKGSLKYAGQCALQLGGRKVFLVSDKGIEDAGWLEQLMDILKKEGIEWVYYPGVSSNPRDYQIEEGAELYLKEGADVIVAIGGGSPMDTAKGIAILANNGGKIGDYEGANKVERPLPPRIPWGNSQTAPSWPGPPPQPPGTPRDLLEPGSLPSPGSSSRSRDLRAKGPVRPLRLWP